MDTTKDFLFVACETLISEDSHQNSHKFKIKRKKRGSKIKGKKRGLWTITDMRNAITALLSSKMKVQKAAQDFQIPYTTLRRKFYDIKNGKEVDFSPHSGNYPQSCSKHLDDQLVLYVKFMSSRLMPFSKMEFLKFAYDLATQMKLPNQFSENKKSAGSKFYYNFIKRYPNLSFRTPQLSSHQRAAGFNKIQADIFFSKYRELFDQYKFPADRIFSCDETDVSISRHRVLAFENGKRRSLTATERGNGTNVMVLLSINAAGSMFVPPLFIFPKNRIDKSLKTTAPKGSIFAADETGWITAKSFKNWLEIFVKKTMSSKESPVLLILDEHLSYKDLSVICYAKEHHVHMICLPPYSAYKMQPLARTIMQPFKTAYNEAYNLRKKELYPLKITLKEVSGLVNIAFKAICQMDLSQSAFRCTGLWPINPGVFTEVDFLPSKNLQEPELRFEDILLQSMEVKPVLE